METRSTARNRTSIDHGAEDAPAAETGARFSENASTHADNAEAAVMASADLMGGQQLGAESPDASDAENAPPRSSSCPPARGRQTSAVQPGQAQQARATPVSRESSGLLRASHRVSGQSPGTPRLSRHASPLPASVAGGSGEVGDNFSSPGNLRGFRVRTLFPRAARQHSATTKSKGLFYTLSTSNSTPESEVKLLGCTRRSF